MNNTVHYKLTRKWAEQAGFTPEQSELIATVDMRIDEAMISKPWCHFALLGAYPLGWLFLRIALASKNLVMLGFALHCVQDGIGHGWILPWRHRPELDDWRQASPDRQARIQVASMKYLTRYR